MNEVTSEDDTACERHRAGIDLAPEVRNAKAARTFVNSMLDLWNCDDPDQVVELLTSEIVTNAIRHAQSTIRLEAALCHCRLRVEAVDDDPGVPLLQLSSPSREGGRGLQLVQALATQWGVEQRGDHKAVWFEAVVVPRKDPGS